MVNQDELAPHVADITRALKGTVDEGEVRRLLSNYVGTYKIPLADAKRTIVKHFGGDPTGLAAGVRKRIADLQGGEQSVDLVVKVLSVAPKIVTVRGSERTIMEGYFGDPSGVVRFTSWTATVPFEVHDSIIVANAYTKEFRGEVQLNLGERVRIAPSGEIIEVPAEVASRVGRSSAPTGSSAHGGKPLTVSQLREGARDFSITVRIGSVTERLVEVEGVTKTVYGGVCGDATGRLEFTSWHDHHLQPGDVVTIGGGYVRGWRGIPQLNFDERASVTKAAEGAPSNLPSVSELGAPQRLTVAQVEERGGAQGVAVEGIVVDVRPGSGLIARCPDCNRVLQNQECRTHGRKKGTIDLRVKAVLDDGTGALSVVFNRALTERILERDLQACAEMAEARGDDRVIDEELRSRLVARPLVVIGNVMSDDYGAMLIASELQESAIDVPAQARAMLEDLEA